MCDILEVHNLQEARICLRSTKSEVILTNPPGSSKYMGILLIDYLFKTLKREFPELVSGFIINAGNDKAAFMTAVKLGYDKII